nr:MAG TPA: hypothetical protein [Bacteriophage sp.]DAH34927.1 MAG TPA: hypothetical protein [Bacteriophage sp.]
MKLFTTYPSIKIIDFKGIRKGALIFMLRTYVCHDIICVS